MHDPTATPGGARVAGSSAAAEHAATYAELHCISNFTFLRGASHPDELVRRAAALKLAGLALTDECSLAGVVRAHAAAKETGLRLVVGSELVLSDGLQVVALAADRRAYAALAALVSAARRAAPKGSYLLDRALLERHLASSSCLVLWTPRLAGAPPGHADLAAGRWLKERFAQRLWLAVELERDGNDARRLTSLRAAGRTLDIPLTASGNVTMHVPERRLLQDTLTAIRLRTPIEKLGFELAPNAERHLHAPEELARRYPLELLHETLAILERIDFSLDELRYEYPSELVPPGATPASHLRALVEQGQRWRWPDGASPKAQQLIEHELELIAELRYEPYFLTVHDIVQFARSRGILCQGRGSAANSVVCFVLGITEVDPARMQMLVERFISKERNEPPDIDVDFEHERREEVIQYLYRKYTRERAALAATVITYRPRSAIRDVGKALGLDDLQVSSLARSLQWWEGGSDVDGERAAEAGFDAASPKVRRWLALAHELMGFPRHLSQHVGGFVIAAGPLAELVPIENAAMPERTVIQWDKDDLEELGLLKVDVLGLGMLSAIRRSFELIERWDGRRYTMAELPSEDGGVYDMICKADTMGVFQIESRAQMSMLPRLKPRSYYDLVIEVALIRPGPIQGDMVHPYLRRRGGEEPVSYPSEAVRGVLERTLGVPIFQEQVMQLAIVAAGFTPGEADGLRRAMAAWRRRGGLEPFEERLIEGMRVRGYAPEFARQIFSQIKGFGEYGFPESHAASFALLVYVSAWLKHHEPAAFCCALLNSQPMGFYAPAQLVRSAREHGVVVRGSDVCVSDWECTLERGAKTDARSARERGHRGDARHASRESANDESENGAVRPAVRLGLCMVKGLSAAGAARIVAARATEALADVRDLAERAALDAKDLGSLAAAGALASLAGHRHRARWDVAGLTEPTPLLGQPRIAEGLPLLRKPAEQEDIDADYRHAGLTLGRHPLELQRERLRAAGVLTAAEVAASRTGGTVSTAGLVITRQRPSSAAGVVFVTLEDETGYVNLVVWEKVGARYRSALLGAALLGVVGRVQREGEVLHVVAARLLDLSEWLGGLTARSRDFH